MGNGGKRKMMLAATVAALAIGGAPAIADARPASSVVAGSVILDGAGKAAYAKTDPARSVALGGGEGDYNLKFQDGTLYLNHATVSCIAGEGILGDGDLRIMLNGDSLVTSRGANGIEVDGSLWIGGAGSLKIESGMDRPAHDGNDECDGIYATGDVVIDGVSVKARGLDQGESEAKYGVGIYSEEGDVVIKGAKADVEARGGRAAEVSAGISANAGAVKIEGGTVVATAGNTDAGKGSISSGIHAAHDISIDAARLTATAGEAASSAGMGSAFGSITVAGDSVVSASSSAKEGVGISAVSASVAGGKLLASGNFEAVRCPKGFTVAPDAGEVMSVATADGVKALPSDVDGLDGVNLETVGGAPYTKEGELPVDALRANVLYADEKRPVSAAGSARDENSEKSESPAKKDGAAKDDAMKKDAAERDATKIPAAEKDGDAEKDAAAAGKDASAVEKDVEGTVEKVGEDVEKALGDSEANTGRKSQVAKAGDASAPSRMETAGRKSSVVPRLPQTGDANLALPLIFAGIIGVALLAAGIALLFDRRK